MFGLYHEYRFYSPVHDEDMVRVSVFDMRGREFFAMVPAGKRYRQRRTEALDDIDTAIGQGCDPGQVVVNNSAIR